MSHVIMIEEPNGNQRLSSSSVIPIASSNSNDDLSQSLSASEYTDADESMSAPTEYLAEFLSAVMQKDYRKALKYCKLILDFEPNNVTAREFYPLIEERMRSMEERSSSDEENENYGNVMFTTEDDEVQNVAVPNDCFFHHRLDESVDDLVNVSHNSDSSGEESDDYYNDFEEKYSIGSNKSISSNAESENTTHSYSNSLLEDEEDNNGDVSDSDLEADDQYEDAHLLLPIARMEKMPDLSDLNNGNYHQPTSCSDSESPTEPLTQKVVPIQ
ncbi:uncharacterized protein LOC116337441 isoform X2 [Contarinia nasturtii]|uniref:uncharacterized protein LOC116337441 isoform X2 n=1 Tax=Contarinia nasturtii TaxID=265458 RepID=UPI0012D3CBED|nr:uncharacterized protein LOC116337441 isoform X2 [Contarinia nasturtii]XP_031617875.1 uncharacterized protein LOC116337441 isoform X2 [Contarinia nasturtii]